MSPTVAAGAGTGASSRFVVGLDGLSPTAEERRAYAGAPPLGYVLFRRNLSDAAQAAELVAELRSLSVPAPLLFVDQEGGTVDRLGPLLGLRFPGAAEMAACGSDRVHEGAYLMGKGARLLGFDVDFAPVLDLGPPGAAVVAEGRTFGFHAEDVVVAGLMFLNGLARAGVASCLKHFPGLGRGVANSHVALPVVDAHDVDLMVTDVAPFVKLARGADGVMLSLAAYPGFTGDLTPASLSPVIHRIVRSACAFDGVVYSDDLNMGALGGSLPERSALAAAAGCDVVILSKPDDSYEEAVARVSETEKDGSGARASARTAELRRHCANLPKTPFTANAWQQLQHETHAFLEELARPRGGGAEHV